jgi:hypothetical protein
MQDVAIAMAIAAFRIAILGLPFSAFGGIRSTGASVGPRQEVVRLTRVPAVSLPSFAIS